MTGGVYRTLVLKLHWFELQFVVFVVEYVARQIEKNLYTTNRTNGIRAYGRLWTNVTCCCCRFFFSHSKVDVYILQPVLTDVVRIPVQVRVMWL